MNEYNHHKVIKHAIWDSLVTLKNNKGSDPDYIVKHKILCVYSTCDACVINHSCVVKDTIKILCKASDFADSITSSFLSHPKELVIPKKLYKALKNEAEVGDSDYMLFNSHYNIYTQQKNNAVVLEKVKMRSSEYQADMRRCDSSFGKNGLKKNFYSLIHGRPEPEKRVVAEELNKLTLNDILDVSNQSDNVAFLHAMRSRTEKNNAQDIYEKYFKVLLSECLFRQTEDEYLHLLGIVLHGIMDSFTPSHTNFQWFKEQDMGLHAQGDVIPFRDDNVFEYEGKIYYIREDGSCSWVYEHDSKGNMIVKDDKNDKDIINHINRNEHQLNEEIKGALTLKKNHYFGIIGRDVYEDEAGNEWTKQDSWGNAEHQPKGDLLLRNPKNGKVEKYTAIKFLRKKDKSNDVYESIRYVLEEELGGIFSSSPKKIEGFNLTNDAIEKDIIEKKYGLTKEFYKYVGTYNFAPTGSRDIGFMRDMLSAEPDKDGHYEKDYVPHKKGYNFYTQLGSMPKQQVLFDPGQFTKESKGPKTLALLLKGYGYLEIPFSKWNIKTRELDMLLIFLRVYDINSNIDLNDTKRHEKLFNFLELKIDDYYIADNSGKELMSTFKNYTKGNWDVLKGNIKYDGRKNLYLDDINKALQKMNIGEKAFVFSDFAIDTVKKIYDYMCDERSKITNYEEYKSNKDRIINQALNIWQTQYEKFHEKVNKDAIDPELYRNEETRAKQKQSIGLMSGNVVPKNNIG